VIVVSCYHDRGDFPQVLYFIDKSHRTLIWLDTLGVKDSGVLSEMSVIVALTKGMYAINIWNKGIIVSKKKGRPLRAGDGRERLV